MQTATPNAQGRRRRRRPRGPAGISSRPPRFDAEELLALVGPPVWQATHDATVLESQSDKVLVEVEAEGHEDLKAEIPAAEFMGHLPPVGAPLVVRLLDAPVAASDAETSAVARASFVQGRDLAVYDEIMDAKEKGEPVKGVILGEVKGGYAVALGAENRTEAERTLFPRAFLPRSHGVHPRLHHGKDLIGEADLFTITEAEPERANFVVSRKERLDTAWNEQMAACWDRVNEGDIVKGEVRSLAPFGAFVDIGGVDALLHRSDLSWDREPRVSSVLKVGQLVEAKVILKDREQNKLKIGLKQLLPNPWEDAKKVVEVGSVVEGDVVALTDYGAFVRVLDGVEGLVHLSEASWERLKHVSQKFKIGERIKAKVLEADFDKHRLSLSTRALEDNPFAVVAGKYPPGTRLQVKVKSITDFGAFVALDDNVDGLIHIGELSWTERVQHPSQVLKVGDEIEVVVLDVDVERQRVACSVKQLTEDPMKRWEQTYRPGSRHVVKVKRVTDAGIELEADEGLDAFCSSRDLSSEPGVRPGDVAKVGDDIELEVKSFDRRHKKVAFSLRAVVESDTAKAYAEYKEREREQGSARMTLGDQLKGQLKLGADAKSEQPASSEADVADEAKES